MRLLHRVLSPLPSTNPSQRTFVAHLIRVLLLAPGHATFRNLRRYSTSHENTFARQFATPFDFGALNKAAMVAVVPPDHARPWPSMPASWPQAVSRPLAATTSGTAAPGRVERGLEVSVLAWGDITHPMFTVPLPSHVL